MIPFTPLVRVGDWIRFADMRRIYEVVEVLPPAPQDGGGQLGYIRVAGSKWNYRIESVIQVRRASEWVK